MKTSTSRICNAETESESFLLARSSTLGVNGRLKDLRASPDQAWSFEFLDLTPATLPCRTVDTLDRAGVIAIKNTVQHFV